MTYQSQTNNNQIIFYEIEKQILYSIHILIKNLAYKIKSNQFIFFEKLKKRSQIKINEEAKRMSYMHILSYHIKSLIKIRKKDSNRNLLIYFMNWKGKSIISSNIKQIIDKSEENVKAKIENENINLQMKLKNIEKTLLESNVKLEGLLKNQNDYENQIISSQQKILTFKNSLNNINLLKNSLLSKIDKQNMENADNEELSIFNMKERILQKETEKNMILNESTERNKVLNSFIQQMNSICEAHELASKYKYKHKSYIIIYNS